MNPEGSGERQNSQSTQQGTYEMKDAMWVVESQEYVDVGPDLKSDLSDEPETVEQAWALTLCSLQADAKFSREDPPGIKISENIATYDSRLRRRIVEVEKERARNDLKSTKTSDGITNGAVAAMRSEDAGLNVSGPGQIFAFLSRFLRYGSPLGRERRP